MTRGRFIRVSLLLAGLVALPCGCATVKPWQKEHLVDPTMSFDDLTKEASREMHWIEAREGSTGGTGAAGGGCACN